MSTQGDKFTEIADAIRAKKGTSNPIKASDFAAEIASIEAGGLPEYMSAKNFTFDGNACTGYVGDTSVPQIIIPKSYSYTITPKHLAGSYVNIEEIRNRTNSNITNITLCNEDGSNVHSYASTDQLRNNFSSHFGNETKVLIQRLTHRTSTFQINSVKTYVSNILLDPVYYNNGIYNVSSFVSQYITTSSKDLTLFGKTIEEKTFYDGEDVQVTSIKGKDNASGFSSYTGDIIVPPSITDFGDYAFYLCENNRILIDKITSLGNYAFNGCKGIDKISLNYISTVNTYSLRRTNIDNLYVPSNITTIASNAFEECPLKSVIFENGIINIGGYAFYGCKELKSIDLPASVKSIGDYAFSGVNLDSVSVNSDNSTFYSEGNCLIYRSSNKLIVGTNRSIIPNNVLEIGGSAFSGRTTLSSITIPDGATKIGNSAFYGCSGLTSVTIPNSVTSIGQQAFIRCENLKTISIPENLQQIQYYTFGFCSNLTSITIPASVTNIATYVFNGCSALTEMTIKATTPPTLSNKNAISSATTTIYIPAGALSAYQNATNWSNFADKFVELSE